MRPGLRQEFRKRQPHKFDKRHPRLHGARSPRKVHAKRPIDRIQRKSGRLGPLRDILLHEHPLLIPPKRIHPRLRLQGRLQLPTDARASLEALARDPDSGNKIQRRE